MSMLTTVTGAAAALASGLDAVAPTSNAAPGLAPGSAGGLTGARKPDAILAKLTAPASRTAASATPGTPGKTSAAKASGTTAKATTAKATAKTTAKTTAASTTSGYSKAIASDDFAFLKDPSLTVEEKLFRFMCAVAKRNDDEVVKKMEEMKGGPVKAAAAGSAPAASSAPKPSTGTTIWGALKALVPPLGLAAQVVGDAKLKSMITQVSGPVLGAAATALGLPALAPLAMQAGPGLASALLDGKLDGGASATSGAAPSAGSSGTSSNAASPTAAAAKNEQVQLMELQRLVDKQKEMFAMISNVLRAQHDTRMAIIGNVR
jgi:hypothetical protein